MRTEIYGGCGGDAESDQRNILMEREKESKQGLEAGLEGRFQGQNGSSKKRMGLDLAFTYEPNDSAADTRCPLPLF